MLAAQRRATILERVRATGAVRVADLVTELRVSDMTIRRDLEALAERDLVAKVHGGATVPGSAAGPASLPGPDSATDEPGFAAKSARQRAEKAAIARAAAALVTPDSAVALSAGTTTAALAALLVDVPGLTVVTNSVPVAEALHGAAGTVVLTGGVRTRSDALVGPVAVATIRSLHLDTLFLGVHGMAETAGFTTPNLLEAETDRALVQAATQLVVLADHTKWGTVGMCSIAPLSAADLVITDSGLPAAARSVLAESAGELTEVSP